MVNGTIDKGGKVLLAATRPISDDESAFLSQAIVEVLAEHPDGLTILELWKLAEERFRALDQNWDGPVFLPVALDIDGLPDWG